MSGVGAFPMAKKVPAKRAFGRDTPMVELADGTQLSERAYKFAEAFVRNDGGRLAECAIEAGYSGDGKVVASNLLRDERVLGLIDLYARTRMRVAIAAATATIEKLMKFGGVGDNVKLKAAESILDRASKLLAKIEHVQIDVEVKTSTPDGLSAEQSIKRLLEGSGYELVLRDPVEHAAWLQRWTNLSRHVGGDAPAIDAEFEEVTEDAAQERTGREGLEDLL